MISGKLGRRLAVALMIILPIEKWMYSGLGPADLFMVAVIITTWPAVWRQDAPVAFPLALPVWLVFVGSLIGMLAALDVSAGTLALTQEVYLYILFLSVVNVLVDRGVFVKLKRAWLTIASIEAVLLTLQRFGITIPVLASGGKAAIRGTEYLTDIGRSVGTFINTNAAGGYMLISFFLLLASPFPRRRPLRLALLFLLIVGLFSTGSNAALGGLVVGLIVTLLYWIYKKGQNALFGLGLASLLMVFLVVVMPSLPTQRSTTPERDSLLVAFSRADHKLQKRIALWNTGASLIEDYPLGIGPNVTRSVAVISLHNDYVAFFTERGPLGFIGLMLLLGELLFWLGLAARNGTTWAHHQVTGAFIGGFVGIAIVAIAHEVTHGRPVWLFFAFIYVHYKLLRVEAEEPVLAVPGEPQPRLTIA